MRTRFVPILLMLGVLALGATAPSARASVGWGGRYGDLDEHTKHGQYVISSVEQMAAFTNLLAGKINNACRKAYLARLDFQYVRNYTPYINYCEIADANLPAELVTLLGKMADLNTKIAQVLGQDPAATFSIELGVTLNGDYRGSIASESRGGGVFLDVLPDWKVSDFAPMIYAHEIIHALTFNTGPTAEALSGLADHPLLNEALPDLISAEIHGSPKLQLGEAGLPACLKNIRDESPVQGFGDSFARFYTLANLDAINRCCSTVDLAKYPAFARTICESSADAKPSKVSETEIFVRNKEIKTTAYSAANLAAPFEAEACRITTKTGLVYLDNCDSHQFAYPLVSFFFRLKELTGKSQVTAFFEKIRAGSESSATYECRFTLATKLQGNAKAFVVLRPLLGPFMALRDSLSSADQAAFDQAWKEHDFGKMIDLDRIYRNETLPGVAQLVVKTKNTLYRNEHDCVDPYDFDPVACQVTCDKKH